MRLERHEPYAFAGPTLNTLLWKAMMQVTAKIMEGNASEKTIGRAIGLSQALALFTNPYDPNPKAIREEAKRLWREEHDD